MILRRETVLKECGMKLLIVISCIDCSSLQMHPMNSNYSKRSGQKRLNHTVQLHHIKLTSSMPFMNPFGSFSISMFGFLFILKRRSFSDRGPSTSANTLHLPYDRSFSLPARLASLATRPMFQDDSWLYLEITRGLRVRSLMSRGLKLAYDTAKMKLLHRSSLCFVSFSSFLFV